MRVGLFATAAAALLPEALRHFNAAFADIRVDIVECDADEGAERVASGLLDIAVVFAVEDDGRLDLTPLGVDEYHVVLPADHPAAAAGDAVDTGALRANGGSSRAAPPARPWWPTRARSAGFAPDVVIAADDQGPPGGSSSPGLGITVVPELLGWGDEDATVVRRLRPAPTREVQIALARQDWHPPATLGFRAALLAAGGSIAPERVEP